jgi:hypothetical protein
MMRRRIASCCQNAARDRTAAYGGGLTVKKPDGSFGIVDFNYLSDVTPMPFKEEWSGGSGVHEHHKFVVTDFSLSTAKVFTGSSNLSTSGEAANGDNLVMIEDARVATSYAIEALRVFDHLHFRTVMSDGFSNDKETKPSGAHTVASRAKSTAKKSTKKGKVSKKAALGPDTTKTRSKAAAIAAMTLKKPTAITGKPAWFSDYYEAGSQKERDRKLFSH